MDVPSPVRRKRRARRWWLEAQTGEATLAGGLTAVHVRLPYRMRLCGRNSVVECQLPKLDVVGSSPIARFD